MTDFSEELQDEATSSRNLVSSMECQRCRFSWPEGTTGTGMAICMVTNFREQQSQAGICPCFSTKGGQGSAREEYLAHVEQTKQDKMEYMKNEEQKLHDFIYGSKSDWDSLLQEA